VIAFDLPGFGRSDKPADFDYSLKGFGRWLLSFMDQEGIEKASFVGNSMGGAVAMRMAIEHPGRVERLALLGAPTYLHNHPALIWPIRWPVVGKIYEWILGPWAVAMIAPSAFFDRKHVTKELLAEYGLSLKSKPGREAVAKFLRNAIPPDAKALMARYKDLALPILVVRGEHDAVVDARSAERFAKEVQRGRLLSIPQCGHAAQEERPDVVVPALLEFLAA
jgi:pimeloyl-ACP methyl ester carboxylesterase